MSRATYLGADLGRTWIAEFSIEGWRAVIGPSLTGRPPFLLTVHDPGDIERMRFVGVTSATEAIEKALSFLGSQHIAPDNRAELFEIAVQLDAAATLAVTLGVPREIAAFAAGVYAAGARNYHLIAATISALGKGTYQEDALRLAVNDWTAEIIRPFAEAREAIPEAIRKTRSGPVS